MREVGSELEGGGPRTAADVQKGGEGPAGGCVLGEDGGVEGRGVAGACASVGLTLGGGVGGEGFFGGRGGSGGWHFDDEWIGLIKEWVLELEILIEKREGWLRGG